MAPLDSALSEEEILRLTEETYRDTEGCRPRREWRDEKMRDLAAEDA